MGRRILDDATEKALCRDYQDGMTPLQLSLKYEMSTNGIWYVLVRNDIPRRGSRKQKTEEGSENK